MTTVWAITDGKAGNRNQAVGLAEALGFPFDEKVCRRAAWLDWLPGNITFGARKKISPPWPDVLITCGRRSAAFSLAVRKASKGKTFTIHVLDPRMAAKHFDLVVAPQHDHLSGPNVLTTLGSLHGLSASKLEAAKEAWTPRFAQMPKPWVGVLLGGSTHKYQLTAERFSRVLETLQHVLDMTPGSLLITPSRRTGAQNIAALRAKFSDHPRVYLYDLQGDNPYQAMLGLSDFLLATDDSVNMLSEAMFTGKPIYLLPLPGFPKSKPWEFAQSLLKGGVAKRFAGELVPYTYPPLDARPALVQEIRRRLASRN